MPVGFVYQPDSNLCSCLFFQRIGLAASADRHVAVYHWDWLCGFTGLGTVTLLSKAGCLVKQLSNSTPLFQSHCMYFRPLG